MARLPAPLLALAMSLAAAQLPRAASAAACATYSVCSPCDSDAGCLWCGTSSATGACVNTSAACLSPSRFVSCAAPAPGPGSAALSGVTKLAAAQQAGGIAGCVLVTLAVVAFMALRVHRADPGKSAVRSPAAEQWRDRAARGWPVVLTAFCFQTFGLAAGAAALSIPLWSFGVSGSFVRQLVPVGPCAGASAYYATITALTLNLRCCSSSSAGDDLSGCASVTVANLAPMLGPAAIYLMGLALLAFPAWMLAYRATIALLFLARHRVMPSTTGCVIAGLPVIQGLSWGGYVLQSIGASFLFTYSVLIFSLLGLITAATGDGGAAAAATSAFGAGTTLLGAAMVASFLSCILYSVAGCCGVGNMPGVGMSRRNCCCTELDSSSSGSVVVPPPSAAVQMQNVAFGPGAYPPYPYPSPHPSNAAAAGAGVGVGAGMSAGVAGGAQPFAGGVAPSAPWQQPQPSAANPFMQLPQAQAQAQQQQQRQQQQPAWPPATKEVPATW